MKNLYILILLSWIHTAVFAQIPELETGSQKPMPSEWIDKDTGHRIKRLSDGEGSRRSFYFHNNPFVKTQDGKVI